MGRNRVPIVRPHDLWQVVHTATGQLIIIDQDGHDVFRHPDQVKRVEAFYMAAQAPPLGAGLRELLRILSMNLSGFHGYRPLLEFCHMTLTLERVPDEVLRVVEPSRHQQDLDLAA